MPEQKYPVKVGSAVLPEFRRHQFKDEVHEFLVASGDSGITPATSSKSFRSSGPDQIL